MRCSLRCEIEALLSPRESVRIEPRSTGPDGVWRLSPRDAQEEADAIAMILRQAVDYVQMDVCCQGGFAMGRRLFGEIARTELKFAFHSWGTALEVIAAAHLGICWPESVVEWLEYPCYASPGRAGMYPFPLASEMLKEPLEIDHGNLIVPRSPGLGVTVDESVIERYPWIPGPWSYFHIDSPAETLAVTSDHSVKWERGSAG